MQPQSVLVTGGAGFIGSHLVTSLIPDSDVTVFDSFRTGNRETVPDTASCVEGDIRDRDHLETVVEGVDCLFHEAAMVSVQESVETPLSSHETNATGTLNVLEAARAVNARVILASSAAIYGHPESVPVSESQQKTPTSPYGLDKLTLDSYAQLYNDLYDLETVPLRYFNVYGPGQPPNDYSGVISIFIEQALADEPLTVHGDGQQTRDFVFIDDVIQANLLAATADPDMMGRSYNVGTGESVTITELAETIIDVTDANSDIVYTEGRDGDIRHSEADITRLSEDLGYEPTVGLEEGIEKTVEWFETTHRSTV